MVLLACASDIIFHHKFLIFHVISSQHMQLAQPSECGRLHILISVHAQTAAWQQSNKISEARVSGKCGK